MRGPVARQDSQNPIFLLFKQNSDDGHLGCQGEDQRHVVDYMKGNPVGIRHNPDSSAREKASGGWSDVLIDEEDDVWWQRPDTAVFYRVFSFFNNLYIEDFR